MLRDFPHWDALACASRSMTAARLRRSSDAIARLMARVVFPEPPFWETIAIVSIGVGSPARVLSCCHESAQIVKSRYVGVVPVIAAIAAPSAFSMSPTGSPSRRFVPEAPRVARSRLTRFVQRFSVRR